MAFLNWFGPPEYRNAATIQQLSILVILLLDFASLVPHTSCWNGSILWRKMKQAEKHTSTQEIRGQGVQSG